MPHPQQPSPQQEWHKLPSLGTILSMASSWTPGSTTKQIITKLQITLPPPQHGQWTSWDRSSRWLVNNGTIGIMSFTACDQPKYKMPRSIAKSISNTTKAGTCSTSLPITTQGPFDHTLTLPHQEILQWLNSVTAVHQQQCIATTWATGAQCRLAYTMVAYPPWDMMHKSTSADPTRVTTS